MSGDAMVPSDRLAAYLRQTRAKEPTPRQGRRIRHKNNHLQALEARKAKSRLRRRR